MTEAGGPDVGSAVRRTSTPEYHDRIDALLAGLQPRFDDDEWNRFITPFDGGIYGTLLVNVLALVRASDVELSAQEKDELDELTRIVGVHDPEQQAAPVEIDVRRH